MLSIISKKNIEQENEILKQLCDNIDAKKSTIINAGAGSGKTYVLKEGLEYIIKKYGNVLKQNNQAIICITYTNVAATEIKERLGNSDIVLVSTIHERIWQLIKPYQKELVDIHIMYVQKRIDELYDKLNTNTNCAKYQLLTEKQKIEFKKIMHEKQDLYYKNLDCSASVFRETLSLPDEYKELISSVSNFKTIVNSIFNIERLQDCLEKIDKNENGYDKVIYSSLYNSDRLHKMIISHDTLLEYGLSLISKFNKLKEIIIDSYPYCFIDEYQDTNEKVIKIMASLCEHASNSTHKIFVGYFGDTIQNIYNDGIGKGLTNIHKNCEIITKKSNYRSCSEIISLAEKIRNDEIKQKSAYNDATGGTVEFYYCSSGNIDAFIEKCKKDFNLQYNEKIHCFALTNELVAQRSNIKNIYDCFKTTQYYKKNFDNLSTEVLSHDLHKLGKIPVLIYNLIDFYLKKSNEKTLIPSIIDVSQCNQLNIRQINDILTHFNEICASDLSELINSICQLCSYDDIHGFSYKKSIISTLQLDTILNDVSYDCFKNYFEVNLYPNKIDAEQNSIDENINTFLNISIEEYKRWYRYINRNYDEDVIYHTYHGTKGLEFDNVIIIVGNNFGRQKNFFNLYFSNYNNEDCLDESQRITYDKAKNLLYVSTTRAKKNLRILYMDEVNDFKDNLIELFGDINYFVC